MSHIRSITLANPSRFLPTAVLVIDYRDSEHEIEVTSIEMYGEAGSQKLLADFGIDELPRDTQEVIYNALMERQAGKQRLLNALREMKCELRAGRAV